MKKVMAVLLAGALVLGMTGGASAAYYSKSTYFSKFDTRTKVPFKLVPTKPVRGIPLPTDPTKRAF